MFLKSGIYTLFNYNRTPYFCLRPFSKSLDKKMFSTYPQKSRSKKTVSVIPTYYFSTQKPSSNSWLM